MAIFSNFFGGGNIGHENVFYDYLTQKNAFPDCKNEKFKKSKNWPFFKGVNSWFWTKNGHFSIFCFLGNIGHENVFYHYLTQKNAFPDCKNKKFKKSKNWQFFKGVNPWYWSKKIDIFPAFFLGKENTKMSNPNEKTPF